MTESECEMTSELGADQNIVQRDYAMMRLEFIMDSDLEGYVESDLRPIADSFHEAQRAIISSRSNNNAQGRIVTNNIENAIKDLSQRIEDAGLDPLDIGLYKSERVTFVGSSLVWIEDLLFTGLSDIVIDDLRYTVTTSRLRMNLVMPSIALAVRSTGVEVTLLGRRVSAELGGSLEIIAPRIIADMRFSVGIISGISVRSADMEFDLRGIKSDLSVRVQDNDLSDRVNEYLGEAIPNYVEENKNDINAWLSDITVTLLDRVL